jgi:hypothetical protein
MAERGRAQSISLDMLGGAISKAAATHRELIGDNPIPGWYRDPGILGLVIRDINLGKFDLTAVDKAATDLAAATGVQGKVASAIIDHHLIIGVIPFENFTTFGR